MLRIPELKKFTFILQLLPKWDEDIMVLETSVFQVQYLVSWRE